MKLKVGLAFLCGLFLLSLWPFAQAPSMDILSGPSFQHWLGTDSLGRDLFVRALEGSRISLLIGFITTAGAFIIGITVAIISAQFRGPVDQVIMRTVEILMALPSLVILAVVILALKFIFPHQDATSQVLLISIALTSTSWFSIARQVRSLLGAQLDLPYVEAAEAIGGYKFRILFKHVLPNILTQILVLAGLQIPNHLLFESFLSFVGLGIQPPLASWGVLIQEGWRTLSTYPTLLLVPSAFLFLTVLSFNLIFEDFSQKLNPREKIIA